MKNYNFILISLFIIFFIILNISSNNNNFTNAEEMTGINDIINRRYQEYMENRTPNEQQQQQQQQQNNNNPPQHIDPLVGNPCNHDQIMQGRISKLKEKLKKDQQNQQQN
ncbi:hypothetical protein DDB_G0282065 [Dictyostelium discoideum AX4]|uniref:Putative uncharacterized protein DDB_G0282065 n=1 Tax=Dictyostelium discoideum TaxID=44689 RepID=Y5128_DICDI|nr:hypothetical protein DDB_G0282065 [Dictyostelium discoideum AX4]Q54T07.1 RecName: Full=Putative uncharacterized protein DDB_G0282065; Flags: Precursor [Dictyostelium discoideum]EAL66454.1 hypothetical protein DDB_G0282065 [Dictyostelium discoideum AX4]|eukprot:XP_640444.1 hypothetical protein DDB_G0282065 [Dictyostelium discoideum AX4]